MKTRNILFALALLGSTAATAQDVTVLHIKDGTTRRYTNGMKETTDISFYEFNPGSMAVPATSTHHENQYQVDWSVSSVWNDNGKYTVGIYWKDDIPANFKARYGVLMGTKKGLNMGQYDQKAYYADESIRLNGMYTTSQLSSEMQAHYMIIGQRHSYSYNWTVSEKDNFGWVQFTQLSVPDTTRNIIVADLEPAATYFYRTFAEGQVEEGGKTKTMVFYGEEQSFRIPRVMADNGYYPYPCGTAEAMSDFATNFPDSVNGYAITPPTWQQIEPLWNIWRNTDAGKNVALDITTAEFDDGTGYRLNSIPQEFYTWMTQREVVIDAVEGLTEISKYATTYYGDSTYTATADTICNVDAKWGVPGGKYIRFEPTSSTILPIVTYSSSEVVPGVHYKMALNFAPETEVENTDSTATYFLPTIVRVQSTAGRKTATLFSSSEIPATEVTTLEVEDFSTSSMGFSLQYEAYVRQTQVWRGTHNRIMRIAEIRLTPIKENKQ